MNHSILFYSQILLVAGGTLLLSEITAAQDALQPPSTKAPANPAPLETATVPRSTFEGSATLSEFLFGKSNHWDKTYGEIEAAKKAAHFSISIGANHWFHLDRDERIYGSGYGVPTESGTYYWYIAADPEWEVDNGWLKSVGAHAQFRARDDAHDKLRSFYYDTYWFYEAYAYAKTSFGTFKAGQLVTEFGVPWDGTWWEGVPYFDGYKFDPDYGFGWDDQWSLAPRVTLDSSLQYFVASDRVDGSIPGADAESAPGGRERTPVWSGSRPPGR